MPHPRRSGNGSSSEAVLASPAMLKRLTAPFLFALLLAASTGCRSQSDTTKSDRWTPYAGCDANQCKSWYEGCSAECINKKTMSVTECENKCLAHRQNCEGSCGGGSGNAGNDGSNKPLQPEESTITQ